MGLSVYAFAKKDYLSKKSGTWPLYMGILVNGKPKSPISLDKAVKPQHWRDRDGDDNRLEVPFVTKDDPGYKDKNTAIQGALSRANKIIQRYQVNEWVLTYDRFLKEWNGQRADSFETHVKDYIARLQGVYTTESIKKITLIMQKFTTWRPGLDVQDIDYKLLTQYIQFLKTLKDDGGRGNSDVTIYGNLKEFRNIMKDAYNQDLIRRNPFERIRLSKPKVEKIPLELAEVLEFEKLLDAQLAYYLRKTLCWWLLAIYTGRRFGDLRNFYEWDLRKDYIRLVQQKRVKGGAINKVIMIFMNDRIKRVIDIILEQKYQPLENHKANMFLKELASRAGVTRNVHFHLARHTFNYINKKLATDLSIRKDLMGHESAKSTQVYERPDATLMQDAMLKWNSI
jgi:integrase/recombinase XerD